MRKCEDCNKPLVKVTARWCKPHSYQHRTRPSGLKYNITAPNKAWFKKGYLPETHWEKGNTPWNFGMKGIHLSPESEFTSERMSGENNTNWKGGITPINSKIRHSPEYKAWRTAVFERDNYTCRECGKYGGELNADHIKPFADYLDLRFELDNGRTLCVNCHRKTETYGWRALHAKS